MFLHAPCVRNNICLQVEAHIISSLLDERNKAAFESTNKVLYTDAIYGNNLCSDVIIIRVYLLHKEQGIESNVHYSCSVAPCVQLMIMQNSAKRLLESTEKMASAVTSSLSNDKRSVTISTPHLGNCIKLIYVFCGTHVYTRTLY